MKDDDFNSGCCGVIVLIIVAGLCYFVGGNVASSETRDAIHTEAIRAHVAEYYLDQNNERKFRWKECK